MPASFFAKSFGRRLRLGFVPAFFAEGFCRRLRLSTVFRQNGQRDNGRVSAQTGYLVTDETSDAKTHGIMPEGRD
jgi:hypothetical protein